MIRRGLISAPILALALTLAGLLALSPASFAQDRPKPVEQPIGLLFTQTAERGKLIHREGKRADRFSLVLRNPAAQTVWFQDRPDRQSGQIATGAFVRDWDGFGFADDPPNAALTLLDAPHHSDTVILTLGTPRYKPKKEKLVYPARIEEEALGGLSHFDPQRDDEVSTRFTNASLFIDDASGQVINGCLIQAWYPCPGADLSGADLSGTNLSGMWLVGANLSGANLYLASLWDANLGEANLTNANLTNTNLTGANLTANTTGATFCGTIMPDGSYNFSDCPD